VLVLRLWSARVARSARVETGVLDNVGSRNSTQAALGLGRAGLLLPSLTVLCCCRSRCCCFTLISIVAPLAQVLVFNYRLCQKLVISRTPQGRRSVDGCGLQPQTTIAAARAACATQCSQHWQSETSESGDAHLPSFAYQGTLGSELPRRNAARTLQTIDYSSHRPLLAPQAPKRFAPVL
jgi:hypothetical protein